MHLELRLDHAWYANGCFSGASSGLSIGHISPEAAEGGELALIEERDQIRIDLSQRKIDLLLAESELDRRRQAMHARPDWG